MKTRRKKHSTEQGKKGKKTTGYVLPAVVVFVALILVASFFMGQKNATACFGDDCFTLEIARTPQERAYGLMNRELLDADKGMLFVFDEEGDYPFWMKDTKIPLDIIWIDGDKNIVHLSRDTPPCKAMPCPSYDPGKNARYVIELNGGTAEDAGILVGDKVVIS